MLAASLAAFGCGGSDPEPQPDSTDAGVVDDAGPTATVPGVPTSVSAIAGNEFAIVSWVAPADDGGSSITGYRVVSDPGGFTATTTGEQKAAVKGLTNGVAYTFTVKAVNAVGESASSAPSEIVTPTAGIVFDMPGAPTAVSVVAGDAKVTVSWTAPVDDGNSAITGYEVVSSPEENTASTTGATSVDVTGLTNGVEYTFTVKAVNALGSSVASEPSDAVTPLGLPGAPTDVVASPGNETATVSWTAPDNNGGSEIIEYEVVSDPESLTAKTTGATSVEFEGLTNGVEYAFTVTATTRAGKGAASAPSVGVTPAVGLAPGAPTNVEAEAGKGQASVSWNAPESDGNRPIFRYVVVSNPDGVRVETSALNVDVLGLRNGVAYTFTVYAENEVGQGPVSTPSDAVTPLAEPGAATGLVATAKDQSASISWNPPDDDGGSAITLYTVTSDPGGLTEITTELSALFSGLQNGTAYTFTVVATNVVGDGAVSGKSNAVIPKAPTTRPSPPTTVVATAGNGRATLSWKAPTNDGGSPILQYAVRTNGSAETYVPGLQTVMTGLTNNLPYVFTVFAISEGGRSDGADSEIVTPTEDSVLPSAPGAPTNVVASPQDKSAVISWTAPVDNGGQSIGFYTVESNLGDIVFSDTTNVTFGSLNNGDEYSFIVYAHNDSGTSPGSDRSATVIPASVPGVPTSVSAEAGDTQAVVSWNAPDDDGGNAITGYYVTPYAEGAKGDEEYVTTPPLTFEGLSNGVSYTFTVRAANKIGKGLESDPAEAVVPAAIVTKPGAPTDVDAVAADGKATVSWSAPASDGGSLIIGYRVSFEDGTEAGTTEGATSVVVGSLTNGTAYRFTVAAENAEGFSPESEKSPVVTPKAEPAPITVPGAPRNVVAKAGRGSATVTWSLPDDNGGSGITRYIVTSSRNDVKTTTGTSASFESLTNGLDYTFTVQAENIKGSGPFSGASNVVVPATVPDAPTAVVAAPGDGNATVSWLPGGNGGSAILGYEVKANGGVEHFVSAPLTSYVFPELPNGVAVAFTVRARNAVGTSDASDASAPVTPNKAEEPKIAPGAPTSVVAVAGDASAQVSWTAPKSDGGSTILHYSVSTAGLPGQFTTGTSLRFAGLTNGTTYTFTVRAINAVGSSLPSDPSDPVTPKALLAPGAPKNVLVSDAGDGSVVVTWSAPDDDGGSSITGYVVESSDADSEFTTGTAATFTGLTNGRTYTFTVRALNVVGDGDAAHSESFVPFTRPDAPTGLSAQAGNKEVTLTWTTPASDGGRQVTSYRMVSSEGDTQNASSSPAVFKGLTNGTRYTFTVEAVNLRGRGNPSTASSEVTPATKPGAPTEVSATAAAASATVTWTAPSDNGGLSIKRYLITSNTGVTQNASTSPHLFAGLKNGTAYSFTVRAETDAGTSDSSGASAAVTPVDKPGVPLSVQATAGVASATVTWGTPDNGGSPITGYKVKASNGTVEDAVGSPFNFTGLTNDTAYTFTVIATNLQGDSAESAASNQVVPKAEEQEVFAPSAPLNVQATRGNRSATVTWLVPADTGGSVIEAYWISANGQPAIEAASSPFVFEGLTNGEAYTFTVQAENVKGRGDLSEPSNQVTPATVPDAPTALVAVAGDTVVELSWVEPAETGGAELMGHLVLVSDGTTREAGESPFVVEGLVNGTGYTFTVKARNAVGDGASSKATDEVVPFTHPGAPTLVVARAGDGLVTVEWVAPKDTGFRAIDGYRIRASTGQTQDALASPFDFGGLVNGTAYTFTVQAINEAGLGLASDLSNEVTPVGSPTRPRSVQAEAGNAQATVTWTAPANDGGSPISGYKVRASNGAERDAPASPFDFPGLANGTSYAFRVAAKNQAGLISEWSNLSASVTPIRAPDAPTNIAVDAGEGSVLVSWTAPAKNGGSQIVGYDVTVLGGRTERAAASPFTFGGLTNGTAYRFTVTAVNAAGGGTPSGQSGEVTPFTVPQAPENVQATPLDAEATVFWTEPADNGGSRVTGYRVTAHQGDTTVTRTATQSPYDFIGLTNDVEYQFTVKAINARGDSVSSSPSNKVTPAAEEVPATVPGAPTLVTAVALNASAQVSWNVPDDNGGSVIKRYEVTSHPGGMQEANASPFVFIGLTNGTSYTFSVKAVNDVGAGDGSDESGSVVPRTSPDAPTITQVKAGDARVTLTWTPPASDGGSEVTGYQVVASNSVTKSLGVDASPYVFDELTNGTSYTFEIRALNAAGPGAVATSSPAIPFTKPNPPTDVDARQVAGELKATLSWAPPANNGGRAVTSYLVYANEEEPKTAGTTSYEYADLDAGTKYSFRVKAVNEAGSSDFSLPSADVQPVVAPGVPTGVSVTAGNAQATLTWTAPENDGGLPVTGYKVSANGGAPKDAGTPPYVYPGLSNGTGYSFRVAAVNGAGIGSYSAASADVTPMTTPGAPTAVTAVPGNKRVDLSWSAPTNTGGGVILHYWVIPSVGERRQTTGTSMAFDKLDNGTSYSFRVVAENAAGEGALSVASPGVVPFALPSEPQNVQATAGPRSATVSWTAPGDSGGFPVLRYWVKPENGARQRVSSSPFTFTGLTNGESYRFTVTAETIKGEGSPSWSGFVTPVSVPDAPTGVSAVAGDAQARVSWTPPVDTGGHPIRGYIVYANGVGSDETDELPYDYMGLSNGTEYTFTVTAINDEGESAPSDASAVVRPSGKPGAPTNVRVAEVGNGQLTVAWDAPADDGASAITGYRVITGTDARDEAASPAVFDELTNGVAYAFRVLAVNGNGDGPLSEESVSATPFTEPSAPLDVEATKGDGFATVSWNEPADNGGFPIIGYRVTSNQNVTQDAVASPFDFHGLTNGTTYTFTVTALILNGDSGAVHEGPSSAESNAVTPKQPAFVPEKVWQQYVEPEAGSFWLHWLAPYDGGSDILGYDIKILDFASGAVSLEATVGANESSFVLDALEGDTSYFAQIRAFNDEGSGPWSELVEIFIPSPPVGLGAPENVVALARNAGAFLTWNEPLETGGQWITRYRITVIPDGGEEIVFQTDDLSLQWYVAGLTNDVSYTFTVAAVTPEGRGPDSEPSASVQPNVSARGTVNAPTNVQAIEVSSRAEVSWTAATTTDGEAVVSYKVRATPVRGGGASQEVSVSGAQTDTHMFLNPGRRYAVTVTGWGWDGPGVESESVEVLIGEEILPPAAPQNVQAEPRNAAVFVSWMPVDDPYGIFAYIVKATPTGGGASVSENVDGFETSYVLRGLANGVAYTISVAAMSMEGTGDEGYAPEPVTPSADALAIGPPSNVQASQYRPDAALVSWTAPTTSEPVYGYRVLAYETGGSGAPAESTTSGPVTELVFAGLQPGSTYTFVVTGEGADGLGADSPPSSPLTLSAEISAPSAPRDVAATSRDAGLTVSWTSPANSGGDSVTRYRITLTPPGGAGSPTIRLVPSAALLSLSTTVFGLQNNVPYTVSVEAENGAGFGPEAFAPGTTRPLSPQWPQSEFPTDVAGDAVDFDAVKVTWRAPSRGPALKYRVTAWTADGIYHWVDALSDSTEETLSGLEPGTYTFVVTAESFGSGGVTAFDSDPSAPVVVGGPVTAPGAPRNVTGQAGDTSVIVRWSSPASTGGAAIVAYRLTLTPLDGEDPVVEWFVVDGVSPLTMSVGGLTNDVAYTVAVAAENSAGLLGADAEALQPVTPTDNPASLPGAPTDVTAMVLGGLNVQVNWTAPSDFELPMHYMVRGASPTGAPVEQQAGGWDESIVISVPESGTYTFTVTAHYRREPPVASNPSAPVVVGGEAMAPGAPQYITATAGDASVSVNWSSPMSNGGASITRYRVTLTPNDGSPETTEWFVVGGGALSLTVGGLQNDVAYTVAVAAENSAGVGADAWAPSPVTPGEVAEPLPGAPIDVVAVADGGGAVEVFWTPPNDMGSPRSYVVVGLGSMGQRVEEQVSEWDQSAYLFVFEPGTYTFTVTAVYRDGSRVESNPSAPVEVW